MFLRTSRPLLRAILISFAVVGLVALAIWLESSFVKGPDLKVQVERAEGSAAIGVGYLTPISIGAEVEGKPWITHLALYDLDGDDLLDVLVCDAVANRVQWIRQVERNRFEEITLEPETPGPVHVDVADMDGDGDPDLLVACMGIVFPTKEAVGSVLVLENLGIGAFAKHILLENTERVTDLRSGDFDGDGDLDLAVGQFGYDEGAVRWLENEGNWKFRTHDLLNLSGTVHIPVDDYDQDGDLDIAVIVSQEWEEMYLFFNDGEGRFRKTKPYGSTNEDYGSSGLIRADLDRDGDIDLLYSNGDGFDYSRPGSRPWHGVQWFENRGNGEFRFAKVGLLAGAYSPVSMDIDQDGDNDVLAASGFNEWGKPKAVALMCFENDGAMNFKPRPLAYEPTHLITLDVGDIDGDGQDELVSGGFHAYPPWDRMSRVLVWDRKTN